MKHKSHAGLFFCLLLGLTILLRIGYVPPAPHRHHHAPIGGGVVRFESGTLPASVIASGAPAIAAADNGTYILHSGNDTNGNGYFVNGSKFLYFANFSGTYYWTLGSTLGGTTTYDYYKSGQPQSATTFPLTGWVVGSGGSSYNNPPTFTIGAVAPTRRRVPSGSSKTRTPQ